MSGPARSESTAHRVISGTGVIFISQVLSALLVLLAQRFILSNLTKSDYGELFYIQRVVDFVMILFVEAGMSQIVTRQIIAHENRADIIIATFLMLRLGLWLIFSSVLLIVTFVFYTDTTDTILALVMFYLLAGKTSLLRWVYEMRFRARTDLVLISMMTVLDTIIFTVLVWIDQDNLTPHRVILWNFVSVIPGFAVMFIASKDWLVFRKGFDLKIVKDLLLECAPIFVGSFLLQAHDKSDVYFIEYFSTTEELGIYGAAARVYVPFAIVVTAITTGIFPTVARFHQVNLEKCKLYIFHGLKLLLLIALALALFSTVLAPWIIELLSSGRYADNRAHFALYPWVSIPNFIFAYIYFINVTLGFQKRNYGSAVVMAGGTIVANLILTSQWAAYGAIWAKIAATIGAAVVALYSLQMFMQNSWLRSSLFNFTILVSGTAAAAFLLPVYFSVMVSVVVAIPIFVTLVVATKAIQKPELELLQSFVASIRAKVKPGRST